MHCGMDISHGLHDGIVTLRWNGRRYYLETHRGVFSCYKRVQSRSEESDKNTATVSDP